MSIREEYFRKFPIVTYRNVPCINICKRVDFNTNVRNYYNSFYDYSVEDSETFQHVAFNYYGDVDFDWLIYLANDIIDPYHDVSIDNNGFIKNIRKKYGTIESANKQILSYVTNGESDDQILSIGGYNALTGGAKKYWNPVVSSFGISGYQRSLDRITATTNRIISLSFTEEITTPFTVDENIKLNDGGTATVSSSNTSAVILRHIDGGFEKEINYTLTGDTSGIVATVDKDSYKLIQQVIPEIEEVYFKKYSAYDRDFELNEKRREISLVDANFASDLNDQLTDALE